MDGFIVCHTSTMVTDIGRRKDDHIDLCATGDVGFHRKTTLFDDVELLHDALPELAREDVDPSVTLFGRRLEAPIIVAAMTGGTERAAEINRELASIAEERGYGFGLGSQRPMLRHPELTATYAVRDVAPNALVLGNLGAVQAATMASDEVHELCARVGADALCLHLNPAMELVQPGGDRDFRGVLAALRRLSRELPLPVIAKETGCGLGWAALQKLADAGLEHVDVSGAGGTSWVAVEAARAEGRGRSLGVALREWGVPTAVSVALARSTRPRFEVVIATGGVSTGVETAKALALGASAVGIARPVLQALLEGGRAAAVELLDGIEEELRAVMLLTGSRTVADLAAAPRVLGPTIAAWLSSRPRRRRVRQWLRAK
jgi:isopentenyl-diphosphate delta-isomerase